MAMMTEEPEPTTKKSTLKVCDALEQCFELSKHEPLSRQETGEHEHRRQTQLGQINAGLRDAEEKLGQRTTSEYKKKELQARIKDLEKKYCETDNAAEVFDPQKRRDCVVKFLSYERPLQERNAEMAERFAELIDAQRLNQLGVDDARELRALLSERENISRVYRRLSMMRGEILDLGPARVIAERNALEKALKSLSPVALDGAPREELAAMIARFVERRDALNEKLQTATWAELEKL